MATPRTTRRPRHIIDTYYDAASDDPGQLQIWAYADKLGYRAGDRLALHVSTTAENFDLEIARDGLTYDVVHRETGLAGARHATPHDCYARGCGWPETWAFDIPATWRPGGYLITLTAQRNGKSVVYHHIVPIGAAPGTGPAELILVCATGTWLAYNDWGGANAYDGIAGPDGDRFSEVLSRERPWARGFAKLPEGAPRTMPDRPYPAGSMARYPNMEWAYAHGYSKKYASAGWASYERHMARWLDKEGLAFDVTTLHELHARPERLDGHRCAVFVGHDEYWTREMRRAVDRFVEAGGSAARFAGNFLWQTRMEDDGRIQICHKYRARQEDPVMGTADEALSTTCWEAPEVGWPGAETFGVNGTKGVYASYGHCIGRGAGGFTVYRPEHWAFENAFLGYGDILGNDARIYGYEVDGLDHIVADGLPYPTETSGAPEGLSILAMGPATNIEADFGDGDFLFIGDLDAAFLAETFYGEATPEAMDKVARGSGMIVHFKKGKGEVFTAATCEWVNGLRLGDRQVEQVTRNVLKHLGHLG
jgi:hypothetical protein